ncbi:MAG: hypothetical protein H6888_15405 [Nitratireductor sp.]|jgi:hypothetical protein|nr:hypothetical protein [Nitratireductor sp.]
MNYYLIGILLVAAWAVAAFFIGYPLVIVTFLALVPTIFVLLIATTSGKV